MMNQAIQEEIDKGGPLDDIGKEPIEIRPPTLEERIRMARARRERAEEQAKSEPNEADLPEIEIVEVLDEQKPAAGQEVRREAAAVVAERREAGLNDRIQDLMGELEKFDQLQGQKSKPGTVDLARKILEQKKETLLMEIWSDAARANKEMEIFVSGIGESSAKPGDMDTFAIGVRELAKNFQAVGKKNIAESLLDRLKSDKKYVHAGMPQTQKQWDSRVADTRDRIWNDFRDYVDQQMRLLERRRRQKGGDIGKSAAA